MTDQERLQKLTKSLLPLIILLQLVFPVLQVLGVVRWSIGWLLAPLWVLPAVAAFTAAFYVGGSVAAGELLSIVEWIMLVHKELCRWISK